MMFGSCKCQAIAYEYEGSFGVITSCHCNDCRKLQGGTSVIAAPAQSSMLRWTRGHDLITEYESSPGKKRGFCSRCGSPLYSRRDDAPQVLRLRMGSLDTATDAVPAAHIFYRNLPKWAVEDPDIPRYEQLEPGRS